MTHLVGDDVVNKCIGASDMTRGDSLRRLLEDFRSRLDLPAIGAAVVTRERDLDVEVVGHRSRIGSDPVTVDCRWHIGSCAKAITAALYARLVERGATEWGVPIRSLFPDLADEIDPAWSTPTVDEVLICRSGMKGNLSRAENTRSSWLVHHPSHCRRSKL